MDKKLRLSFVSLVVMACVMIAWFTLATFFNGGAAISMVAMLVMLGYLTFNFATDSFVRSRTKDMYVLAMIFTVLELIVFVAWEFAGLYNIEVIEKFSYVQVILSLIGLLFLAYVIFRAVYEQISLRFNFVESLLGNSNGHNVPQVKKVKQSKEFTNGSLEEKPNKQKKEEVYTKPASTETEQEGEE